MHTINKIFSNLDAVQGSAFSHIVGNYPHVESSVKGNVFSNASYEHIVPIRRVGHGSRVHKFIGIINHSYAIGCSEQFSRLFRGQLVFCFDMNRL